MVALTRTTRGGTSTLGEIRAMRAAGLGARFATGLTLDSLVASGTFALLHVDEPAGGGGTTIRHAIALLHIDPVARTLVVGNPLHGRQTKRFDEMEGYWLGEAVLVEASGQQLSALNAQLFSTSIGATRAARRAGTYAARAPKTNSITATTPYVAGSIGDTP